MQENVWARLRESRESRNLARIFSCVSELTLSFQQFLGDLLKEAHKSQEVSEEKLIQYTDTMASDRHRPPIYLSHTFTPATLFLSHLQLQVYDSNKDGKLQLSEMAQ